MTTRPDMVYGISPGGETSISQGFALIAGMACVILGVLGFFFTGFDNFTENTDEKLLGIFAINPFHNVVLIGVGAIWLLAAFVLTRPATEGVNFAIGGFLVLAAVLGYLGYLDLLGIGGPDPVSFLHLIVGVLAVLFSGLTGGGQR
ncbi:MAG: DUF4383 domain-containing protein [Pseudonocardiaceae bacterium]|nr:DUF4383 domain-containing protein [Pseudonocardiaceae bacterium]